MAFRNRAKCGNCGDIVESLHQHDFVSCSCYKLGTTGLDEYAIKYHSKGETVKRTDGITAIVPGIDYDALYADPEYLKRQKGLHGFFLDGGVGVDGRGLGCRYGGNFTDMQFMGDDDDVSDR